MCIVLDWKTRSNVFVWEGVAKGSLPFKQNEKYNNKRKIGKIKHFSVHALKLNLKINHYVLKSRGHAVSKPPYQ